MIASTPVGPARDCPTGAANAMAKAFTATTNIRNIRAMVGVCQVRGGERLPERELDISEPSVFEPRC